VNGSSTSGNGVFGSSSSGIGISGYSSGNSGVYGSSSGGNYGYLGTTGASGTGVYGYSSGSGNGVYGECSNGYGVKGISSNNVGVRGESYSSSGVGVWGYNTTSGTAVYCQGKFYQGAGIFEAYPTSTTWSSNKPATVKLNDGSKVKLFAEEATEVFFSDYGEADLSRGRAHIELDATFLQTVTLDARHPMRVFIQLEGDCNGVFVTHKTATGFDVVELRAGVSDAHFSYRVVCKRKYYEDERLANDEQDIRYNTRMLQTAWPEVIAEQQMQDQKLKAMKEQQNLQAPVRPPAPEFLPTGSQLGGK
jgi:hypothetical protein